MHGEIEQSSLADSAKIDRSELAAIVEGRLDPSDKLIDTLAAAYQINPYLLYSDNEYSPPEGLPDFRKLKDNSRTKVSVKGSAAISNVRRYLQISNVLSAAKPFIKKINTNDVGKAAEVVRTELGLSDTLQLSLGSRTAVFRHIRAQIEKKNIFVFSVSAPITDFRGFCIEYNEYWAIAFNSADGNHGARSFTLAHEFVHVSLGEPGISGELFASNNEIERFCNKVAATALAPGQLLRAISFDHHFDSSDRLKYVNYFANKIGLSRYMVAIRLKEVGIISNSYFDRWLQLYEFSASGLELAEGGGSPVERDEGKYKIAKFGAAFSLLIAGAVINNKISSVEASKLTGIKKKYIQDTYDAATIVLRDA